MMKVSRREFSKHTGAFLAAAAVPAEAHALAAKRDEQRPNIVFILADDMGFADLSCYGTTYKTPNIDRIARDGVRLTQAYANSCVCSATRTALMTGRYQHRYRVGLEEPLGPDVKGVGLDPALPTLPRHLGQAGYRTALVGKWHLGEPPAFGPLLSGYDRFFGIYGGATDYFAPPTPTPANTLHDGDKLVSAHRYLTDELGDRAVREIDEAHRDNQPLFLSVHFTAPHWPWEGPEDIEVSRHLKELLHNDGGSVATYQKMLTSLDENVGKILAAIKATGRSKDTLVIFTSDNGGERFSNTWPLTGVKGELLEGGIRVPVLAAWPRCIPRGLTSDQVAMTMDWMPTLLVAATGGITAAESDGINLMPQLTGGTSVTRDLFWRYKANHQAALRSGHWKYLKIGEREYLFDLSEDARERANLAKDEPERFERMKQQYARWEATMLPYPPESASHDVRGTIPDRY